MASRRTAPRWRPRLEIGRALSRVLCVILALIGALPVTVGALLRTSFVTARVARETAALVDRLVGVQATYRVSVQLLPLNLVLEDLVVQASDGPEPAFTARRVAVTPRLFSLLAGRLDAGEVEVDQPRARVVLRDGKLANVAYRLPESKGPPGKPLERAPFATLSLTDASASLDVDGIRVETGPMDLDVFAEQGLAFEVALRAAESRVSRTRTARGATATDDDVLCELDARVRVHEAEVLVRRLSLVGSVDADPASGTFGSCKAGDADPRRVAVRLSEVRATIEDGKPVVIDGHVVARAPTSIADRFAPGPFHGWVGVVADVRWDARHDLPEVRGHLRGGDIGMGPFKFVGSMDSDVEMSDDELRIKKMHATYGHARVVVEGISFKPLADGIPLRVHRVESEGLTFPDLMEWIDVTPNTIVHWDLDHIVINEFGGTLDPVRLDGDVFSDTSDFEITDRAYHDPARKHMIGVKNASVRTRFGVRPDAVQFMSSRAAFGTSELFASVVVGFHNDIWLSVPKSKLDLADASPLVDIPMDGEAELEVQMAGKASKAELTGTLRIEDLVFAGFPLGDVESSKVRFVPLVLDLSEVHGKKGTSRFYVPSARLDFDSDATLVVDARVSSDRLDFRDFFSMWHFDEDPRFDEIAGRGKVDARVQYDMGGRRDHCGSGYLRVDGRMDVTSADLYGEHYDSGESTFDFRWMDQEAGYFGMQVDVPSVTLRKGDGTILGSVKISDGAKVRAQLAATSVPLSRIDALPDAARALDGNASAVVEVGGTLDAMVADVQARIGSLRAGRRRLPASELEVHLAPEVRPVKAIGHTRCGRPITGPFDREEFDADRSDGTFHVSGQMFGGQIAFDDVTVTRQRHKIVRGDVAFRALDLGALAELAPTAAASERQLEGRLSGKLSLAELPMDQQSATVARVDVEELRVGRDGYRVELVQPAHVDLGGRRLAPSGVAIALTVPTGERVLFDLRGGLESLGAHPGVDVTLAMRPTDLGDFARLFPQADRVEGTLGGSLTVGGTWPRLVQKGRFTLADGELALRGSPVTLSDVQLALAIDPDEARLVTARAKVGGGTVEVRGGARLEGMELGPARATITARDVAVPGMDGVRAIANADLQLAWQPSADVDARSLPKLTGDVTLQSFRYTRKVTMAADIDTLTRRGRRTQFESYDPRDDSVELDVRVRAARPLEIDNDLIEAKLNIADPGLVLSGTNQRFGMRGELDVVRGGRIRLRRNDFEITQGLVRFDDPERIAPRVDVTAVTDYHRYTDALSTGGGGSGLGASATSGSGVGASTTSSGRWRITMRAHGDPDTLKVDLSSEPNLSRDDIFLLLTLGLTRAELDRAQSATAGGSVALEALGRLTGADEAVTETIPVIDEFKLGSAYSSRTGRTEPTVTIGKRLAQRIRAYVTSGLTESREIRSNLQWRLSPRVSVEGSYDNVNDISSSTLGNLGADVRWRLEFE